MQHYYDLYYVFPTYHKRLLEFNFATEGLVPGAHAAMDELMENINRDLKEFNNSTPELIVRNSSIFNLRQTLIRGGKALYRSPQYMPKTSYGVSSEHIKYLSQFLSQIFDINKSKHLESGSTLLSTSGSFYLFEDSEVRAMLNAQDRKVVDIELDVEEDEVESLEDEEEQIDPVDSLLYDKDFDQTLQDLFDSLLDRENSPPILYPRHPVMQLGRSIDDPHQEFLGERSVEQTMRPLTAVELNSLTNLLKNPENSSTVRQLDEKELLNDTIIDGYMRLLQQRDASFVDWFPSIFMPCNFYTILQSRGYRSVARYTFGLNIFRLSNMVIPVHLENHWALVVIRFDRKHVEYYDSLAHSCAGGHVCSVIEEYLIAEFREKLNSRLDTGKWKSVNMTGIPLQENSFDCGVFVCQYANFSVQELPLTFSQTDMPRLRQKMKYQLLTGQL